MTKLKHLALTMARRAVDMWVSGEPVGRGCAKIGREMERILRKELPELDKREERLETLQNIEDLAKGAQNE